MQQHVVFKEKIINQNFILIIAGGTAYCNETQLDGCVGELAALYQKALSYARERGAKIVYKHRFSSQIKALSQTFPAAIAEYRQHFIAMHDYWLQKTAQPLTLGDLNGPDVAQMSQHSHAMHYARAHNAPIGQFRDCKTWLESIINRDLHQGATVYL